LVIFLKVLCYIKRETEPRGGIYGFNLADFYVEYTSYNLRLLADWHSIIHNGNALDSMCKRPLSRSVFVLNKPLKSFSRASSVVVICACCSVAQSGFLYLLLHVDE